MEGRRVRRRRARAEGLVVGRQTGSAVAVVGVGRSGSAGSVGGVFFRVFVAIFSEFVCLILAFQVFFRPRWLICGPVLVLAQDSILFCTSWQEKRKIRGTRDPDLQKI